MPQHKKYANEDEKYAAALQRKRESYAKDPEAARRRVYDSRSRHPRKSQSLSPRTTDRMMDEMALVDIDAGRFTHYDPLCIKYSTERFSDWL